MEYDYNRVKKDPLTEDEVKEKAKGIREELEEVKVWVKEEEAKIKSPKSSPQRRGAAKRALKKATRRVDTVKGQIIYWDLRVKGMSHFRASIEMNEYWAECKEKKEESHTS